MADYGDESKQSTISRMANRVDPDKFKAFKSGFTGKKDEEEDEEKPSLLAAMKRKLLGG